MRVLVLLVAAAAVGTAVRAQSTVTTYRADYTNGGFTSSSATASSDHTNAQVTQGINGQIPLEKHESRIIRSDPTGSVTETILRRYDPTGQLVSTERTVTETHNTGKGDSSSVATTYRSDVNGNEQIAERSSSDTHTAGNSTTTNTLVERAGASSSLEPVEKRSEVTETEIHGKDKQSSTTASVFRGDPASGFREAERRVTNSTVVGNRTVTDSSDYEPGSVNGALQFQERRVSTTSMASDGSQVTVVDVYTPASVGNVQDSDLKPQLRKEEILTRVKQADGSMVDTFSIREADASVTNQLGAPKEVTRSVCTGKCEDAPAVSGPAPMVVPQP